MKRNKTPLLTAGALLLFVLGWLLLRYLVAAQLADSAERDLALIAELVAVDLKRDALSKNARGAELLTQGAGAQEELRGTLARADIRNRRNVYFFLPEGRSLVVGGPGKDGAMREAAPTDIVARALGRIAAGETEGGAEFEAYPDHDGEAAVGIWRWYPELGLGLVVERPYARFVRPVAWLDAALGGLLVLVILGFAVHRQLDVRALLASFRKPDLDSCGPYRILRLIGEGAMANVYLARHEHLGRLVALKRLKVKSSSDETLERFDREARLASQLHHPNIITVLDHGPVPGGGFYYAMEYIQGLTLTQWVEEHGPVPPGRVIRLLIQVCAAVGAMHQRQLLHRDIKPDNVIAYAAHGDYDLVKLLDFGLIRDLDHEASRDLTRGLRVLGTPAFMAPERLLDPKVVDPRTDLYGVGCIGFFLLTGRRPFEATLDADLAQQVLHVPAPRAAPNSIFSVPTRLDDLIDRALAKDMTLRPESAAAFAAELEGIAKAAPWHREPARLWWMSVQAEVNEGEAPAELAANTAKG
ncbi:MAG: serine/threonine protein kinase [Betaproteobacteria bacterium]|nr:serine/threonine protein kinase [Betaproteobacteria bacterium]